jgi:hypothetical protein
MQCQICEQEEAIFTIIPVGEGMPQLLGAACYARAGLDFAKTILPPEEIMEALGPIFVTLPQAVDLELENPPAKPKARKSKAKAQADEGTAGGPPEAPPAAANE